MKLINKIKAVFLVLGALVNAQTNVPMKTIIYNVQIFNGKDNKITKANILIENNIIKKISTSPIPADKSANTTIIDGKGNYIMPGLIDAHTHVMFENISMAQGLSSDFASINLMAVQGVEAQLLRGFTTVRDLGGGSIPMMNAINGGYIKGPRIFSSGAFISQSGGHGDFGVPTDAPRTPGELSYHEKSGITAIADGVDAVTLRSREQLRQGATQLKIMAGGGVTSSYDPIDVSQYTEAEIKAAVAAAENWGTYVTVHAYTSKAVNSAINAGVKCIDHGQLIDESTAKMMAEKGVWWSLQPLMDDEDAVPFPEGSDSKAKYLQVTDGTDKAYKLAKKYNIKTAWGTDILFDPTLAKKQGKILAKMTKWFTPFEVLKMATSGNAELLQMSGKRNPYNKGKLGEISEGAYADLILVNGNPLENIKLIENPDANFLIIMKDGKIYKNILK